MCGITVSQARTFQNYLPDSKIFACLFAWKCEKGMAVKQRHTGGWREEWVSKGCLLFKLRRVALSSVHNSCSKLIANSHNRLTTHFRILLKYPHAVHSMILSIMLYHFMVPSACHKQNRFFGNIIEFTIFAPFMIINTPNFPADLTFLVNSCEIPIQFHWFCHHCIIVLSLSSNISRFIIMINLLIFSFIKNSFSNFRYSWKWRDRA